MSPCFHPPTLGMRRSSRSDGGEPTEGATSGRRPSEEEELLLLLCGTSARRTLNAGRIRALVRLISQERFLEVAVGQRLSALALHRLEEVCGPGLPRRLARESSRARERDRPLALAFEAAGEHVLDALAAAGLSALALKGAPLARTLYGDPALRSSTDIDVLVRPEELSAAIVAARALGYGPPVGAPDRGVLPTLHFVLPHLGGLPTLELHWRVHWLEEEFSRRVLERSVRPGRRLAPRPVDEVAMLLLFYSRDGFAGLRLAADLAACVDAYDGELGRSHALEPLVREHPELRAAWTAAAKTAQVLVGVPAWRLVNGAGSARRVRLAIRLANWTLSGDLDQAAANVSVIDGLLTPRGGLGAFVRRDMLPSRAAFALDNPSAPSRHAGVAWLSHPVKRLMRYALALRSVRRGRRYAPLPASFSAESGKAPSASR